MSGQGGGPSGIDRAALDVFAVLVVALMLLIVAQVVCSVLDLNPLATFAEPLPVLGSAVTLNSLLDAEWWLLAVVGLLPAALVWRLDGHVRVDFLYARMSPRRRALVDIVGTLALTLPFLALSIPAAWTFAARSFAIGEGSANDGLDDLFLVKAVLPAGLALLAVAAVLSLVRDLRSLTR